MTPAPDSKRSLDKAVRARFRGPVGELQEEVILCKRCPRLVRYLAGIEEKFPAYWCRPVPSFGDVKARILLLGLAPGRYGSNRTARMFTGDASGKFMYDALHRLGLASRPDALHINDGLELIDTYITATARCAPPQNKPTPEEQRRCVEFVRREIALLPRLKVVVALGKIAHDAYLRLYGEPLSKHAFKHGNAYAFTDKPALVDVYHPSRQNTQTGLLTMPMFLEVLRKAKSLAGVK